MARKPIECPANQWTTLVSNFGSGIPKTFTIDLEGNDIDGEWEERANWWVFPTTPKRGVLEARMTFHRKWINAIYKIRVCPRTDVIARVR